MRHGFARIYFNLVYNRLYDITTARLLRYVQAQQRLAVLLAACPGDRVLCVGLGTGNELAYLSRQSCGLHITGVDFSGAALDRARRKSNGLHSGSLLLMDAHHLGFGDNSFDRVLSYHVTDFLDSPEAAAGEMLRVLKPGGRYVISFPSGSEDFGLGAGLISHGFESDTSAFRERLRHVVGALGTGLVYLPLLLRPRPSCYTRDDLSTIFRRHGAAIQTIEEDAVYHDFIVSGTKMIGGVTNET